MKSAYVIYSAQIGGYWDATLEAFRGEMFAYKFIGSSWTEEEVSKTTTFAIALENSKSLFLEIKKIYYEV
jgi:hypothetical protein